MVDFSDTSPYFFSTDQLDPIKVSKEVLLSHVLNSNVQRTYRFWESRPITFQPYSWRVSRGNISQSVWRFGSYLTHPCYISVLENVLLRQRDFAILSVDSGRLLKQSLGAHRAIHDPTGEKEHKSFPTSPVTKPQLSKIPVAICNDGWHNYWHWHMQTMASVLFITDVGLRGQVTFVTGNLNRWQKECLHALGVTDDEILELQGGIFGFDRLVYPSFMDPRAFTSLDPYVLDSFQCVKRRALIEAPDVFHKNRPQWLYVSRRDAPHRSLANEADLIEQLSELGFVEVIPSELSYKEQIATFSAAKVVVGPHGAGLTNIGFLPNPALVIEIFSAAYRHLVYYVLSRLKGAQYEAIVSGTPDSSQENSGWHVDSTTTVQTIVDHMTRYGFMT